MCEFIIAWIEGIGNKKSNRHSSFTRRIIAVRIYMLQSYYGSWRILASDGWYRKDGAEYVRRNCYKISIQNGPMGHTVGRYNRLRRNS